MKLGDIAGTVIVLILCVGAMALFPVAHGPYSAVHGPTTTMRARRLLLMLRSAMALAAATLRSLLAPGATSILAVVPMTSTQFLAAASASSPLRC